MKKLFLFVVMLAALTVFCSTAFAQYGYAVPTLETVRREGSTANVYTYRDANGNKIREIEYYVNDDGSYGNIDVYYGSGGLASFRVKTDYQNGVCTMSEQSISYSSDNLETVNARETTFNPGGKVDVMTYTTQDLGNKTVTNGMETDGTGRKIGDFMEERWKDEDNNDISRRTVYNPDKTVSVTHRTENPDGTEIRMELTYDENDRKLHFSYTEFDDDMKEVYYEGVNYDYDKNGDVNSENVIINYEKGTQLHFNEKSDAAGSMATAEGQMLDKDGNKLADYSSEKTWEKDGSGTSVDTYIYPNGRVDIISKKVDADGKATVNKQLDFKAAGEETGETEDTEYGPDSFDKWYENEKDENIEAPDDELISYFKKINGVWEEVPAEVVDAEVEEVSETTDTVPYAPVDDPDNDGDDDGAYDDNSDGWDGNDSGSDGWNGDDGGSDGWTGDDGGSDGWDGNDGGSDSWTGDDGGSDGWDGNDGGSDSWGGYDGGSDSWGGYDGGSDGWGGYDGGFDGWD